MYQTPNSKLQAPYTLFKIFDFIRKNKVKFIIMRGAIGVVKPCNIFVPKKFVTTPKCTKLCTSSRRSFVITSSLNSLGSDSGELRVATRATRLGDKWQEFQGIKNWDGLLDPLDEDLRGEILRYGDFVEATYQAFEFDTSSPSYATCKFSKNTVLTQCGLGGTGYKLTKNLRATCGVELPRWIDRAPGWMSTRSSWIGYVAVCNDKEEIARLGRRDVVIAFRGTATCPEWMENLQATLACLPGDMGPTSGAMVQSGFLSMYTSRATNCPSLRDLVREEVSRIIQMYGDEPLSITITGHSLGAALATLAAYDITSTIRDAPLVTVASFGGPRVGNVNFRRQLEKKGSRILRIVNSDDVITKVPGFVVEESFASDKVAAHVAKLPGWLQRRVEDTQWVYADVGKELRLSSRDSPYASNGNMATCHDLKTYLHLVNGFVSSTCPFRATAERVLSRTQDEKQFSFR